MTKVKEGDFILIDYDMLLDDENKTLIETTDEKKAKDAGIYNNRYVYQPELVVVGQGHVVKGLDEVLVGMEEKEEKKGIVVPSEKGFGRRNPQLIEERSVRWLKAKNITPARNVTFQEKSEKYGIRYGRIISVKKQKAKVDFNKPLAGKTLLFDVKVNEIVTDPAKKVELLAQRHFQQVKDIELDIKNDNVEIILPMFMMISYLFDYSAEEKEKEESTDEEVKTNKDTENEK
ncbi:MAG: FKBP-type peptidyl-prolyl cis-trans isomerase [Candidatus Hodarchaeales archaeon]